MVVGRIDVAKPQGGDGYGQGSGRGAGGVWGGAGRAVGCLRDHSGGRVAGAVGRVVGSLQRVVDVASAAQDAAIARLAAIEPEFLEGGTVVQCHRGLGHHWRKPAVPTHADSIAQQRRVRGEIEVHAARVGELRHEADVGERRRAPVAERAGGASRRASASSASRPTSASSGGTSPSPLRCRCAEIAGQIFGAQRKLLSGWMSQAMFSAIARTRAPSRGVAGNITRVRKTLVEPVDDGEALGEHRRRLPVASAGTRPCGFIAR